MSPFTTCTFIESTLVTMRRSLISRTVVATLLLIVFTGRVARCEIANFKIDPQSSSLTFYGVDINGTVVRLPGSVVGLNITAQDGADRLVTSFHGYILADIHFSAPSIPPDEQTGSIQFLGGEMVADNSGLYFPGPAGSGSIATPANFGFVMTGDGSLFPTSFVRIVNVTNYSIELTSDVLPLPSLAGLNLFLTDDLNYVVSDGTVGIAYGSTTGPTQYFPLSGTSLINQPIVQNIGRVIKLGQNRQLSFSFLEHMPLDPAIFDLSGIGNIPVSIVVSGQLVATAVVPEVSVFTLILVLIAILIASRLSRSYFTPHRSVGK